MARNSSRRVRLVSMIVVVISGVAVSLIGAFNAVANAKVSAAATELLSKQMTLDSTSASEWSIIKDDLVNHHPHPEFWTAIQKQCNVVYSPSVARANCDELISAIKVLTARGDMTPLRFVNSGEFMPEGSAGTGIHGRTAFVTVKGHFLNRTGTQSRSTPSATYHVRLDLNSTQQWKLSRVRVVGYNPS